ncbi:hypothetical protein F511_22371 [Dorcoceras hygrometricum]|uniref:Uncharacterized protein n=1 Tax=Dorcoceras hygrometricum TaxID=472368 RepID=A0A2Z7D3T3_9LAMI|nr:hypothetical protein F511_22371 [Dorcoceras hygrometricum]
MSASGESSTTMHRLLHASRSHPIPPPDDPNCLLQLLTIPTADCFSTSLLQRLSTPTAVSFSTADLHQQLIHQQLNIPTADYSNI